MGNKTIFLDRDGVINKNMPNGGYVTSWQQWEWLPTITKNLQILQNNGYQFIIITNQGGIQKGLYSHESLNDIHQQATTYLQQYGITITAIYYCPHHPAMGENCICRKPDSLLLEKAIAQYQVDVSNSYFIGDKASDITAAKKAGIKGILIPTNTDMESILPLLLI